MIYLCVIMPYRFMEDKKGQRVMRDILFHEQDWCKSWQIKSSYKADTKIKDFFSDNQKKNSIMNAEKYFDEVFQTIFDERICTVIFESNIIVTIGDFINNICPKGSTIGLNLNPVSNFVTQV